MRYFYLLLIFLVACKPKQPIISSKAEGEKEFQNYLVATAANLINNPAPDFQLTDIQGNTIKLSNYKGKVVLLNFWFMACAPCITEISSLRELHKNYTDKGMVLLAVSTDAAEPLRSFANEKSLPYKVFGDGKATAEQYGVHVYPTTYIIDKEGIVRQIFLGASDWDGTQTYRDIKPKLEEWLGK